MKTRRSLKGISPLVAVIMLIAFTLIVAGILAGWTQQFAATQQQAIEYCLDASVFLYSGSYNSTHLDLVVYNNGEVPLSFITLLSFDDNTIKPIEDTAETEIDAQNVVTLSISISEFAGKTIDNLTSVTIQSRKCPGAQDFLLKVALEDRTPS